MESDEEWAKVANVLKTYLGPYLVPIASLDHPISQLTGAGKRVLIIGTEGLCKALPAGKCAEQDKHLSHNYVVSPIPAQLMM